MWRQMSLSQGYLIRGLILYFLVVRAHCPDYMPALNDLQVPCLVMKSFFCVAIQGR